MRKITLKEIYDFQEKCLNEYNLAVGLNECKKALQNHDAIEEQVEYLRRLGQPCISFADGKSWEDFAKEQVKRCIELRRKFKNNGKKNSIL